MEQSRKEDLIEQVEAVFTLTRGRRLPLPQEECEARLAALEASVAQAIAAAEMPRIGGFTLRIETLFRRVYWGESVQQVSPVEAAYAQRLEVLSTRLLEAITEPYPRGLGPVVTNAACRVLMGALESGPRAHQELLRASQLTSDAFVYRMHQLSLHDLVDPPFQNREALTYFLTNLGARVVADLRAA